MIQRPSRVACKPFGAGPGELKTVSTLPILRVRMRAGSKREAAIAVAAVAAVIVNSSLRFMAAALRHLISGRATTVLLMIAGAAGVRLRLSAIIEPRSVFLSL